MATEGIPHVVLIALPAQGHAPPMLRLAELLSNAGFFVTFVNTEATHKRILDSSSVCDRLVGQQSKFRFRTIPDGFAKDTSSPPLHQFLEILESLRIGSSGPLKEILTPVGGMDPDGWPPVTCAVADGVFTFALDIVEEVGIPLMVFRTSGACSIWTYCCISRLIEGGDFPFPEAADLDGMIKCVPGMEHVLRRRDLPSVFRHAKSGDDSVIQYMISISNSLVRGRALILNTFEALEGPVISQLRSVCPVTYAIGPIHVVQRSSTPSDKASLWREDRTCMSWLDSQAERSVVYVSFGSVATVTRKELLEFWDGLIHSGHRFLWVVRPGMVEGNSEMGTMFQEEEARGRGCLVDWAPQDEVLAHPAVGCFLTHSGWNSTLESVTAGVPMICWPFMADQYINSRFVGRVWRVGLDMKDTCERNTVERMVRRVMDGDESGDQLRRSAAELAKEARTSTAEGGTSHADLQKLILHIRSLCS